MPPDPSCLSPLAAPSGDITPDNVASRGEEIKRVVAEHGLVLSNFASNQSLDGGEGSMPGRNR
jgi:hypothetical protein